MNSRTIVIRTAAVALVAFAGAFALADHRALAQVQSAPTFSTLFYELWGFGSGTTGGLGGRLYVVTRRDDPLPTQPGTLRYGVESLSGPTWIVFDEQVFPAASKRMIYLNATLQARSDLTIDGRGSYVSLRRAYYLDHVNWERIGADKWQCHYEAAHRGEGGPIVELRSAKNVIFTHLEFQQEYRNAIDDPGVPDISNYTRLTMDCFGDAISIFNLAGEESERQYDRIWINHSEFRQCGDECIGVTHPNETRRAYLTISNNLFAVTNKGFLLGGLSTDAPFMIAASFYRNRFVGVNGRQPRVGKAYAHAFNNVYEDWKATAIAAHSYSRVLVEHNVFRPITTTGGSWSVDAGAIDARLWARNNVYSVAGTFTTPSFPACNSAWYYPCNVPIISIARLSYADARDTLRPLAGWKDVSNDVR
jgi:hypothetical protein